MPMSEWPFLPDRLTDVLSEDLLRFIQSGSAVHTGLPLAIVELRAGGDGKSEPHYIPMDGQWLQYTSFCKYFRGEVEGKGPAFEGADRACKVFDGVKALDFLEGRLKPEPGCLAVEYRCHMGLWDFLTAIQVAGRDVAVIIGGQRRPIVDEDVAARVDAVGSPLLPHITVAAGEKTELKRRIEELPLHSSELLKNLEAEAKRIGDLAQNHWELLKLRLEDEFLRSLQLGDPANETALDEVMLDLLTRVAQWCHVEFACVFVAKHSGNNVLEKILGHGLGNDLAEASPHFNWGKAGFPSGAVSPQFLESIDDLKAASKAVKHGGDLPRRIAFLCPVSQANEQRAVLCLGRSTDRLDFGREKGFLQRLALRICQPYLERRQLLELKAREEEWEDTVSLIEHELRGSLAPITTEADVIRERIVRHEEWVTEERAEEALDQITKEARDLAAYASEELDFWQQIMGRGTKEFKKRSLPAIVRASVERLRGVAKRSKMEIRMDTSIELLPSVEVIGRTLDVALRNLLENAIKYSFGDRFIEVRGRANADNHVEIDIEDFGIGIPEEERNKVFEKRYRGTHRGRKTVKQGEGLGAWQAAQTLQAHGGYVFCVSVGAGGKRPTPQNVHSFKTTFTLGLPIEQRYRKEE